MPSYQEYFYKEFCEKLGLNNIDDRNIKIIDSYLKILHSESIDFTLSFRDLAKIVNKSMEVKDSIFKESKNFEEWFKAWKKEINITEIFQEMNLKNPCYIPRNHLIEDALKHANNGDMTEINLITKLLEAPFIEKDGYEKYTMPSPCDGRYVTYCGT